MGFPLASEVFDEARFLLNDTSAKLYTNTVLLRPANKAYRELQQNLNDNGLATAKNFTDEITIPQGIQDISFDASPDPELPDNLLYPIELHEKFQNEDDSQYVPMVERSWTPDITPSDRMQYWTWEQNEILMPGASGIVEIRIRYFGGYPALEDGDSEIHVLDSITFLAARVAALAAGTISGNYDKALVLGEDAEKALGLLLSTMVKNRQALPTRRRAFRAFRRGRGLSWR